MRSLLLHDGLNLTGNIVKGNIFIFRKIKLRSLIMQHFIFIFILKFSEVHLPPFIYYLSAYSTKMLFKFVHDS